MGFSLSVGNQGFRGPQLQKKLLKHFGVPARDIATAGRQFPVTARIDIQSGLESLLKRDPETKLLGLVSPNPLWASHSLGCSAVLTSASILARCSMTRSTSAMRSRFVA